MKVLGLTGGIGMGKSTAATLLLKQGVPAIDTDDLARQLVEPGQPALEEIRAAFGSDVISSEGRLLRDRLASCVFADPASRQRLEAILHPRIREVWMAKVQQWQAEGCALAAVIIPLLFETDAARHFDSILCVACSAATQRARLATRGWDDDEMHRRIAAQMPIEKKMALSSFVVWTEGSLAVHEEQLIRIVRHAGSGGRLVCQ